jgi:hypothetical protein
MDGLGGLFHEEERDACLNCIIELSAWVSASNDGFGEVADKLATHGDKLDRVSEVFFRYGARLYGRAGNALICQW